MNQSQTDTARSSGKKHGDAIRTARLAKQRNNCLNCGAPTEGFYCTKKECKAERTRQYRRDVGSGKRRVSRRYKVHDLESIRKCREDNGLRQQEPGKIKCVNCGRRFESWDVHLNRYCDRCVGNSDEGLRDYQDDGEGNTAASSGAIGGSVPMTMSKTVSLSIPGMTLSSEFPSHWDEVQGG